MTNLTKHLTSSNVAALGHSNEFGGSRLTPHFSLQEMTKTYVKGFNNIPNAAQRDNLKRVCEWLEELRSEYNKQYGTPLQLPQGGENDPRGGDEEPIIINSAFRSPAVNKAVGGAPTSNHLTGCAADIHVLGMEQALRYAVLLLDIADRQKKDFDEIILEKSKNAIWLHFAVRAEGNRRKIVFMTK